MESTQAPSLPVRLLPVLCLVLLSLAVYGRAVLGGFLAYDDELHVSHNRNLPATGSIARFWQAPYAGLYMPVTYTLWAVQYRAFQHVADPEGAVFPAAFHLVNVLTHAANGLLVYWILSLLGLNARAALAGALVFVLHPVQAECASWVTSFKQLCGGFFTLLALGLYLRPGVFSFAAATLAYGAALLSMPLYAGALLAAAALSRAAGTRPARALPVELGLWAVLALGVATITSRSQPGMEAVWDARWFNRLQVAGDALAFYAAKVAVPYPLGPDYGRSPVWMLADGKIFWTAAAGWLGLGLALWGWGRRKVRVCAVVFLAGVLPVLGFVPFYFQGFSTVADRYLYLAMLGPALGAGWWVQRDARNAAAAVPVLALLAVLAFLQCGYWKDDLTLSNAALSINPRSLLGHNNLAIALAKAGRRELAKDHLRQALALQPRYPAALIDMGNVYIEQGRYEEALPYYRRALREKPDDFSLRIVTANMLAQLGLAREALEQYQIARTLRPEDAQVYEKLALLFGQMGKPVRAEQCRQRAAMIVRGDPRIRPDPPGIDLRPDEP